MELLDGTKINKKEFDTWIKALRSGEYKQGVHRLQKGDSFCCLGVACEVLDFPKFKKNDSILGGLPEEQKNAPQWLKDINLDFYERTYYKITHLNDGHLNDDYLNDDVGMTFDEIADCLEAVYIHKVLD